MTPTRRSIRINMTLQGELGERLIRWQERGLVSSAADAVRQALLALNEKFVEMDLRAARLPPSEGGED